MEVSFSEIIRETKNAINARLDMLENLARYHSSNTVPSATMILAKIDELNLKLNSLQHNHKILPQLNISPVMPQIPEEEYCDGCGRECDGCHGYSGETAIANMNNRDLEVRDNKIQPIITKVEPEKEVVEEEVEEEVVEEEEEVEEEIEEEAEEEVEEEVEEEAEEAVEQELEEFEYKGMTLYRDSENKVYRMDEDGAISDPIGLWDDSKQRIKKL